jgi:hypothetical protein
LAAIVLGVPAIQAARAQRRITESQNNLKQIGVGLWSYDQVHGMLPLGADTGTDGRPRHGWQIRLLPYLEGGLFIPIDFDYAWDDPFNAPYFKLRVPIFLIPGVKRITDERGFALSHYAANSHVFGRDRSASLGETPETVSRTILVGEVADGFLPWGQPGNWRDPAAGLGDSPATFGSPHPLGVQFLMGDGSVRFIERGVDQRVLKALAGPADEEGSDDG